MTVNSFSALAFRINVWLMFNATRPSVDLGSAVKQPHTISGLAGARQLAVLGRLLGSCPSFVNDQYSIVVSCTPYSVEYIMSLLCTV